MITSAFLAASKVFPVILLILLGNLLQRIQFIKEETVAELKKIVVSLSLPALLFMAFAEIRFESRFLLVFIAVFGVCLLMLVFGNLLSSLLRFDNVYFQRFSVVLKRV